jgi:hypothetical protein
MTLERYKLRPSFFTGPGKYCIDRSDGGRFEFEADPDGYFECPWPQPVAITVFAKYAPITLPPQSEVSPAP